MDEKIAQVIHFLVRDLIAEIDRMILYFRNQNFFNALQKTYVVLDNLSKLVEQLLEYADYFNKQEELVCDQSIKSEIESLLKAQQMRDYILLADLYELSIKPFLLRIQEYICSQYGILFDVDQYNRTLSILYEKKDTYKELLCDLPKECIFFSNNQIEFLVEPTSTGAITLAKIENENKYYFHTNGNVFMEADHLANYWYQPEIEEFVVYGLSLGYHVKSLLAISGYSKIRVYESNLITIQAAMAFGVLEELLKEKRITFIYDKTYQQINHYVAKMSKEHLFLVHYPSLYAVNNKIQREALEDYFIQYNSVKSQRKYLDANFKKNLFLYDDVVDTIKEHLFDKDIYIIGAGPSLDHNISELKKLYEKSEWKKRSIIIAVCTVFHKLLKIGIVPDYIVASDAKPNTYKQIVGLEGEIVPLIGLSTLYYEFFQNYKGKKYIVFQEGYDKSEAYVKEHPFKLYETGGSVITIAIDVALQLQGRRVILIGLDLAFTGGRNHASETPSSFIVDQGQVIYVKDIYGNQIATGKNLNIYRKWIERRIKNTKVEIIDATEGGALIWGTKVMALRDVRN